MKERPILFSTPMVKAILEGRKTQTRRAINPQPELTAGSGFKWKGYLYGKNSDFKATCRNFSKHTCKFGIPGDHLWVRETWNHSNYPYGPYDTDCLVFYRADYDNDSLGACLEKSPDGIRRKWKPAIHMHRSASRILLEITNIRVERLQDISEEDAIAEGVRTIDVAAKEGATWCDRPRRAYRFLWNSINGKGSWDLNPWVWVIQFRRVM